MQIKKTRNFIGLIGVLLALLGFLCPFAESQNSWTYANHVMEHDFGAFFESLKTFSERSTPFFAVYLVAIVLVGIAFLFTYHRTGLWLTLVPTAFFLLIALQKGPALISAANIGFWLSAVGLLVMLFACATLGLNEKLFPFTVFHCQKAQSTPHQLNRASRSRMAKAYLYEKCGYPGIVGAATTLIGLFLPFVSFMGFSTSFYDYFNAEHSPLFTTVYVLLLIAIAAAYALRHHAIGCFLSLPYLVYHIFFIVSNSDFLKAGQIGFWLTVIGTVVMVLSPYITKEFVCTPIWARLKESVSNISLTVPAAEFGLSGFVGVFGAVLTLIGFFVPFFSYGWISGSLCEIFNSELSPLVSVIYVVLLVGISAAFLLRHHTLGGCLAVPHVIFLLYVIISGPEFFQLGQAGFWLSLIGVVLMAVAPIVGRSFHK